jgi:phosphoglycerate dehydrogenase-like enzyme
MILMGTAPFEPFDYFESLLPDCKIVVSASAGYNEFPVDWMTERGIWFCNTKNAIAEPTADMAILLTLAVVRDFIRADKSARAGLWRNDHVTCTDPTGLTLGIIGMGAIGKVDTQRFRYSLGKVVADFYSTWLEKQQLST